MFTGIITEIGTVRSVERRSGGIRLSVSAEAPSQEMTVGDSVAIAGVCQTAVSVGDGWFSVDAVEETQKKTTLGRLQDGARVNLELAVRPGDRLGGHMVQGHVDCAGEVREVVRRKDSWIIRVAYPGEFRANLVPVGSVAMDGVSLTVAELTDNDFSVSVIPHTMEHTTLKLLKIGTAVNLEFDILGKYVLRQMTTEKGKLTLERLRELGF